MKFIVSCTLQVLNKYLFPSLPHLPVYSQEAFYIVCATPYTDKIFFGYTARNTVLINCGLRFRHRTVYAPSRLEELEGIIPDLKDQHSVSYFKVGFIVENRVSAQGVSLLINSKLFTTLCHGNTAIFNNGDHVFS